MKTFFASLLGTLTGFLILLLGGGVLLFLILVITAAMGDSNRPSVEPGSYLVFDLSTNITDAPSQFDDTAFMAAFTGQDLPSQLQTRLVTRALREAAADSRIKGILIKGSFSPAGYGTSFAALQEVRRALQVFKESNKPIQAYLQYPDTRDFYVASLATDVALDPQGGILMPGLASEPMFYAGAFEKFGIGVQVSRVGNRRALPHDRRSGRHGRLKRCHARLARGRIQQVHRARRDGYDQLLLKRDRHGAGQGARRRQGVLGRDG